VKPTATERVALVERRTAETAVTVRLALDGRGEFRVATGIGFLDHMLELLARHGGFDLELRAEGDLQVDQHHTVEDVGIALGEAFDQALGERRGIARAGCFLMPMDEALALAAVDFSGRATAVVETGVRAARLGDLQAALVTDFFEGFGRGARATVHLRVLYGRSGHHKVEALFKAFARATRAACRRQAGMADVLPSTKGLL
jgi:imidazoleglycerol-phosphate dehydratase